jgi:hypothetical protein
MKSVLKMDDLDNINDKYIVHFVDIINTHKEKLHHFKLAYNNYTKVITLYKIMLEISGEQAIDVDFFNFPKLEKIKFLEINNIKHKLIDDIIAVYPSSFEEGQMIYPNVWCIKKSKKMWKTYNDDNKHVVLFRADKIYGISHSETKFYCYSKKDISISYRKFNKEIGQELPLSSKIKNKKHTKTFIKKYKKEFWVLLTLTSFLSNPFLIDLFFPSMILYYTEQIYFASIFSGLLLAFLNQCISLFANEKILEGAFIQFIAICMAIFFLYLSENILKQRIDKITVIDTPLVKKYQNIIAHDIRNFDLRNITEAKHFLMGKRDIPSYLFEHLLIDIIKKDDHDRFNFLLHEIKSVDKHLEEPLFKAVDLDKTEFVNNILKFDFDILPWSLGDSINSAINNNNWTIFTLLVNHKSFNLSHMPFRRINLNEDKQDVFYKYILNKGDYNYDEILSDAIYYRNTILTKLMLSDKYIQPFDENHKFLEKALIISDVSIRNEMVKIIFDKTQFDYSEYSSEIITNAILFGYDYIIDDFILNIDKTNNIDFVSIFKLLELTQEHNIKYRLEQTEAVREYLN